MTTTTIHIEFPHLPECGISMESLKTHTRRTLSAELAKNEAFKADHEALQNEPQWRRASTPFQMMSAWDDFRRRAALSKRKSVSWSDCQDSAGCPPTLETRLPTTGARQFTTHGVETLGPDKEDPGHEEPKDQSGDQDNTPNGSSTGNGGATGGGSGDQRGDEGDDDRDKNNRRAHGKDKEEEEEDDAEEEQEEHKGEGKKNDGGDDDATTPSPNNDPRRLSTAIALGSNPPDDSITPSPSNRSEPGISILDLPIAEYGEDFIRYVIPLTRPTPQGVLALYVVRGDIYQQVLNVVPRQPLTRGANDWRRMADELVAQHPVDLHPGQQVENVVLATRRHALMWTVLFLEMRRRHTGLATADTAPYIVADHAPAQSTTQDGQPPESNGLVQRARQRALRGRRRATEGVAKIWGKLSRRKRDGDDDGHNRNEGNRPAKTPA